VRSKKVENKRQLFSEQLMLLTCDQKKSKFYYICCYSCSLCSLFSF